MDFIPHIALGSCQIYSYPWQALIGDLDWDFAGSSRKLAVPFMLLLRDTKWDTKDGRSQVVHAQMNRNTHTHSGHLLLGSVGRKYTFISECVADYTGFVTLCYLKPAGRAGTTQCNCAIRPFEHSLEPRMGILDSFSNIPAEFEFTAFCCSNDCQVKWQV